MIIGMFQGHYHTRQLLRLLRGIPHGSTRRQASFHDTSDTTLAGITTLGPATWHAKPIFGRGQLTVDHCGYDLDLLHEQVCRINGPTVWLCALPHLLQARQHCSAV